MVKNIDKLVYDLEKRKTECQEHVDVIGNELVAYFESHSIKRRKYTKEQAIFYLQSFFHKYGLYVGNDTLHHQKISKKWHEEDFYIANYIYDKKSENISNSYEYILDLVKGYFLQAAIYFQAGNSSMSSANFSRVSFYYDTPVLLRLLEYQGEEENNDALALHKILVNQQAHCFYFKQTEDEVDNILNAYQKTKLNGSFSKRTLEGLDKRGYGYDDISRIKLTWRQSIESHHRVCFKESSLPIKNESGEIDFEKELSTGLMAEYVRSECESYPEDNLERDVESIMEIYRLRDYKTYSEIERCPAIFVTTNEELVKGINKYIKDNKPGNTVPLLISIDYFGLRAHPIRF